MVTEILQQQFASDFELAEVQKLQGRLFDFVPRQSRTLFVTIGDSWTYGARLAEERNSDQYRIEAVYGNLVSESLGADFLNLAVPGINNLWMIDKYLQLAQIADRLPYDNIKIFITLTEFGREIGTNFDLDPALNDGYRNATTPRDVAVALADYQAQRMLSSQHRKVSLHLGCNYVTNIYAQQLQQFFMPRTWLEVLVDRNIAEECLVVGSWVIPKFKEILSYNNIDQNKVLEEINSMIDGGQARLDIVYNTGFNHRVGYGHPNSVGHHKWAQYIVSQLTTSKD